ncbi:Leucine rich repeat protein [Entamoeba marina]
MCENNNTKQLDSYSALISSKYFETSQDYINLICVNSKFKETTEKLRFNPIPIKSLKLFPKIQTQYLYSDQDTKIEGIDDYEIWYKVNYDQYLKYKQDNIKFKYIVYTRKNRFQYGDTIPEQVNILGLKCFSSSSVISQNASKIKEIDIPTKFCHSLQSITLPPTLTSLGNYCFCNCFSLKTIILPPTIKSLSGGCFSGCSSLTSINLPSSLTQFGKGCFFKCDQLKKIITVPDICYQDYFFMNIQF